MRFYLAFQFPIIKKQVIEILKKGLKLYSENVLMEKIFTDDLYVKNSFHECQKKTKNELDLNFKKGPQSRDLTYLQGGPSEFVTYTTIGKWFSHHAL